MPTPIAALERVIRMNSELLAVHRRDSGSSSSYGNSITYSSVGDKDIFIAGLEENMQPTDAGERQAQRLVAYTTPSVDLRVNDRIDYNGEKYEVLSKTGKPTETDVGAYSYRLDNV